MGNERARGPAPVWGVELPPQRVRSYDQLYVVNKTGVDVLIVSNQVETLRTHWYRGRTHFCTETKLEPCWLDHRETGRPRFAGWVACVKPGSKKIVLLRLTEHCLRTEPDLLTPGRPLRGRLLHVWREGETEWAEMAAQLGSDAPFAHLPPEIDVRFQLEHVIEADDRQDRAQRRKAGPFRRALEASTQVRGGGVSTKEVLK